MRNEANRKLKRGGLIAGTLAAGVAALALTGGTMPLTSPAFAEAVTVNPPVQNFGFADVVEKVTPAVVSVRVTQDVAAVSDEAPEAASPFDSLPRRPSPEALLRRPRAGQPRRCQPAAAAPAGAALGDGPGLGLLHLRRRLRGHQQSRRRRRLEIRRRHG